MEPNFRVGQYVFERPLGEGGMAEVWLARHAFLGTPAAIKFLNPGFAGVPEIEERFRNEGRRQGSLNHPNIIKVFGFEFVDNRSFLILQFINGESLDQVLRRVRRLDPMEALRIGISVLNALDYAHEHNIVHRDIKPSNVLLDENRIPYLGDFGIVLATNEKRLTRAGTAMGTALYMSPEQITDPLSVDRRADIYSMGCVFYEMLSGSPPFDIHSSGQGDTDFAVKMAHVQQLPPPLRQRNPAIPLELEAVVMKCLAKNPAERYSSCREVRDALSAAMVASRPYTPPPVPAPVPQYRTPIPGLSDVLRPVGPSHGSTPPPYIPPSPALPIPAPSAKTNWVAPVLIATAVLAAIIGFAIWKSQPTTPVETEAQKQARLLEEQQRQKDAAAKAEAEAKQREAQEVTQAENEEVNFVASEERPANAALGSYHQTMMHNNCGKGQISVAITYMDLEGEWVTRGWWKIDANGQLKPNVYAKDPVFYFYAYMVNPEIFWNSGQEGTLEFQVVDNRFAHKASTPILGKNKRAVKMLKWTFPAEFGQHDFSFTCGS